MPQAAAIKQSVEDLLQLAAPPTIFLCRNDFYADVVWNVARHLPADAGVPGRRPEIVSGGHGQPRPQPPYMRIVSCWDVARQMREVMGMLRARMEAGANHEDAAVTIPIRFES